MVFTDNFGRMLTGIFTPPSTTPNTITGLKDITGSTETIQSRGLPTDADNFNQAITNLIQVGKGSTPATAQDFEIENPFTNGGAEDNKNNVNNGGVDKPNGTITYGAQINPTAGAGAITEVCYFMTMNNSSGVAKTFLMWRNIITPQVNFIAGQAINIDSEIQY